MEFGREWIQFQKVSLVELDEIDENEGTIPKTSLVEQEDR